MTLAEYFNRQIPDYYPTMYLDGYTPNQILNALRRTMIQNYEARQEEAEVQNVKISSEMKVK